MIASKSAKCSIGMSLRRGDPSSTTRKPDIRRPPNTIASSGFSLPPLTGLVALAIGSPFRLASVIGAGSYAAWALGSTTSRNKLKGEPLGLKGGGHGADSWFAGIRR
jgi:hypothetical protein